MQSESTQRMGRVWLHGRQGKMAFKRLTVSNTAEKSSKRRAGKDSSDLMVGRLLGRKGSVVVGGRWQ